MTQNFDRSLTLHKRKDYYAFSLPLKVTNDFILSFCKEIYVKHSKVEIVVWYVVLSVGIIFNNIRHRDSKRSWQSFRGDKAHHKG